MTSPSPEPSWRKPAGIFIMISLIALIAVIVLTFSPQIARFPGWLQGAIYIVAGLIWIVPLRPLLLWMETGKWRE